MLTGLSSKSTDTGGLAFAPAAHLINIVQQVLSAQNNVQIILPGQGEITILPQLRQYHANINDIAGFSVAPAASFETRVLDDAALASIPAPGKDIKDLLWQLAFYKYGDALIEGCSENDVVQFKQWPNLTRIPTTPNTARICALLTRHPTSITLVRRVLGIDKNEVNRVISAACSAGIVSTISRGPSLVSSELATTPAIAETKPEQTQKTGLWNSLFAKISSL